MCFDVTWNGGQLRGDDPVLDALEAADDDRLFDRTERWPDNRLYVDGVVLPGAVIRAALASLRASGYVVVPVEPTDEMWAAGPDTFSRSSAVYAAMLSAAPAFPPASPDA